MYSLDLATAEICNPNSSINVSVVDTMNAFVYKQSPVEGTENIDLGVFVDLWFTEDSSKLVEDMIELMRQDSLKARLDSILND